MNTITQIRKPTAEETCKMVSGLLCQVDEIMLDTADGFVGMMMMGDTALRGESRRESILREIHQMIADAYLYTHRYNGCCENLDMRRFWVTYRKLVDAGACDGPARWPEELEDVIAELESDDSRQDLNRHKGRSRNYYALPPQDQVAEDVKIGLIDDAIISLDANAKHRWA